MWRLVFVKVRACIQKHMERNNYSADRKRFLLPSPPVVFQLSRIMQGVLIVCLSLSAHTKSPH